jgi:hypothetical protein
MPLGLNLAGKKFGRLTVVSFIKGASEGRLWRCRCDCGADVQAFAKHLLGGHTKSCGCLRSDVSSATHFKDITGQRFGNLVALRPTGTTPEQRHRWLCQCDCGNQSVVVGSALTFGAIRSCGCLKTAANIAKNTTHGLGHCSEYLTFHAARKRCTDPNNISYKNYGGRGIKFLFESVEQFYAELGPKPTPAHSIDRINNDGNYEPGNVRWATRAEQLRNRRPSHNAA